MCLGGSTYNFKPDEKRLAEIKEAIKKLPNNKINQNSSKPSPS
jgi:hypothetical protein